ncbi:MAG: nucleoside phosphorylase [Bryobacteraceae bacterium]|nr:nucleoside phosphorylase [Bryobacteraceae bacterium]
MSLKQQLLPLFDHDLNEPPAFTPEALIEAVRNRRGNEARPVPRVCVLEFDGDLTDQLVHKSIAHKYDEWACFHTEMFAVNVDGALCGVIPRTIGGPYSVLIAEQLIATGAQVVIGLTSAGRVSRTIPLPSLVVATSALRDEGTSYHYLPPSATVEAPVEIAAILAKEVAAVGLPVSTGLVWTTDAPYRETLSQLERHAQAGALAVEMQAASLFAFAAARNATVGIIAHVTNAVDHDGEAFDKGAEVDEEVLFRAICRAGLLAVRRERLP